MFDSTVSDVCRIPAYKIEGAEVLRQASYLFDKAMLPNYKGELQVITDGNASYFVDVANYANTDGKFLIEYSGAKSIKELTLLPGNKLRIDWGKYPLDCDVSDVTLLGKVVATYLVSEQ